MILQNYRMKHLPHKIEGCVYTFYLHGIEFNVQ